MRLNNNKRYPIHKFIYLLLLILVGFDLLLYNIDGSLGTYNLFLSPFVGVIVLILIYRGNPVFRYDSDGEVIILHSQEPILGQLLRSNKLYEFPKRKLIGFSIRRWPLRRVLVMKVNSKEARYKTLKVNISYLTSSEVRDLSRSLDSIAKSYKNHKHEEDHHDD